jgi:hypothetical protein
MKRFPPEVVLRASERWSSPRLRFTHHCSRVTIRPISGTAEGASKIVMSTDGPTDNAVPHSRRTWLVASAIAAGVLGAAGVFGFQEWRLGRNVRLAQQQVPLIRAKLQQDDRYLGVVVQDSTTLHGSIRVGGFVLDDAAAADLRQAIDSTSPPVALDWQLRVLGAAALGKALPRGKPATTTTATTATTAPAPTEPR